VPIHVFNPSGGEEVKSCLNENPVQARFRIPDSGLIKTTYSEYNSKIDSGYFEFRGFRSSTSYVKEEHNRFLFLFRTGIGYEFEIDRWSITYSQTF
jgi:hypothetical protein